MKRFAYLHRQRMAHVRWGQLMLRPLLIGWSNDPQSFYIRIINSWGIRVEKFDKRYPPFSVRMGITPYWKVGKWYIMSIHPEKK